MFQNRTDSKIKRKSLIFSYINGILVLLTSFFSFLKFALFLKRKYQHGKYLFKDIDWVVNLIELLHPNAKKHGKNMFRRHQRGFDQISWKKKMPKTGPKVIFSEMQRKIRMPNVWELQLKAKSNSQIGEIVWIFYCEDEEKSDVEVAEMGSLCVCECVRFLLCWCWHENC